MNYFEAQEYFKKAYPGKNITFEFDDKTIRQIECIYTDGNLHPVNHVEHQKLKVTVEGAEPVYIPIMPHRECWSADKVKQKLANDVVANQS
jgi:hypothetical protein